MRCLYMVGVSTCCAAVSGTSQRKEKAANRSCALLSGAARPAARLQAHAVREKGGYPKKATGGPCRRGFVIVHSSSPSLFGLHRFVNDLVASAYHARQKYTTKNRTRKATLWNCNATGSKGSKPLRSCFAHDHPLRSSTWACAVRMGAPSAHSGYTTCTSPAPPAPRSRTRPRSSPAQVESAGAIRARRLSGGAPASRRRRAGPGRRWDGADRTTTNDQTSRVLFWPEHSARPSTDLVGPGVVAAPPLSPAAAAPRCSSWCLCGRRPRRRRRPHPPVLQAAAAAPAAAGPPPPPGPPPPRSSRRPPPARRG